jgi:hypothetical protein
MPLAKALKPPIYTIFIDGRTRRGTAEELLTWIREDAAKRSAVISRMDSEEYADSIIDDAPSYLDGRFLNYLKREDFPTKFDRALRYLSEMEASGIRILHYSRS